MLTAHGTQATCQGLLVLSPE